MIFSSQQVNALQWIHLLILYIFNIIKTITWRNHSYALTWFYFFSNTSYVNCVLHKNCSAIIKCITATSYRSIYSISITVHFFFFFFPFYTINWTYQITRLISHMLSILWIRCAFFVCLCVPQQPHWKQWQHTGWRKRCLTALKIHWQRHEENTLCGCFGCGARFVCSLSTRSVIRDPISDFASDNPAFNMLLAATRHLFVFDSCTLAPRRDDSMLGESVLEWVLPRTKLIPV